MKPEDVAEIVEEHLLKGRIVQRLLYDETKTKEEVKPLKETDFPKNAIIGGVIRGGDSFIAVGDTHIEPYDRVAVFALPDAVKEVDKFFR